jgi:hypothetical protein
LIEGCVRERAPTDGVPREHGAPALVDRVLVVRYFAHRARDDARASVARSRQTTRRARTLRAESAALRAEAAQTQARLRDVRAGAADEPRATVDA